MAYLHIKWQKITEVGTVLVEDPMKTIHLSILTRHMHGYAHLINNPKKFNLGIDDLGAKPCIPHKSLLQ